MIAEPRQGRIPASAGSIVNVIPEGFTEYFGRPGFDPEKTPHCPGYAFNREEVGAVREELDIRVIFFDALDLGADHRQAFKNGIFVCAGEAFEILVGKADDCHVTLSSLLLPGHGPGCFDPFEVALV